MLSLKNYNPYPSVLSDQSDEFRQIWLTVFPQYQNYNPMEGVSYAGKIAHMTGRGLGRAKNFFSKTETKAATLVAYWAADAFVATILLFTTTSLPVFAFTSALLVLHTYATFSVIGELV